ncbi:hypothetical protein NQ314_001299 [Rhamnusium bicolor]|uniref:Uncharacterized protein n=1 Tax=Rhamnusium bicolor TaxID=1586634 RepID=A0AAV8ZVN4_9CUCU|nr:hypothetical protein NQ314_001299 [Rhamnusium bicolor]
MSLYVCAEAVSLERGFVFKAHGERSGVNSLFSAVILLNLKMNKTGSFREGQRKLRWTCKCYFDCKKLTHENKLRLFNEFYKQDFNTQGTYLMGLLHLGNIKRRRHGAYDNPECSRRQSTISYSIPLDGEFIQKRLEVIIRKRKMGDTFYKDRRTNNKKSKFSEVDREQIRQHILSIPREVSHYNLTKSTKEYLSPDLNINRLYRAFLEKFRSTAVSYKYYRSIFIKDFPNLSFHCPRVDTCRTCDRLQCEIAGNSNTAKTQLELHHRKVEFSSLSMKNDFFNDRDFALIEKKKRLMKAFVPKDLHEVVTSARYNPPFEVIDMEIHGFWDIKSLAEEFLNTTKVNITKSVCIRIEKECPFKIKMKQTYSDVENWQIYNVLKKGKTLNDLKKAELLKLAPENKINDVKKKSLLSMIPYLKDEAHKSYYRKLLNRVLKKNR